MTGGQGHSRGASLSQIKTDGRVCGIARGLEGLPKLQFARGEDHCTTDGSHSARRSEASSCTLFGFARTPVGTCYPMRGREAPRVHGPRIRNETSGGTGSIKRGSRSSDSIVDPCFEASGMGWTEPRRHGQYNRILWWVKPRGRGRTTARYTLIEHGRARGAFGSPCRRRAHLGIADLPGIAGELGATPGIDLLGSIRLAPFLHDLPRQRVEDRRLSRRC